MNKNNPYKRKGKNHPRYNPEKHKKHYCKEPDCKNEISYSNYKYGNKRCNSCAQKLKIGRKQSIEERKRRSQSATKAGVGKWMKGKKLSKEHIENIRKANSGEKCYNYIDGRSRFPYPLEFNNQLKESIKQRDNYKCQGKDCNITQEEHFIMYGRDIEIHHIDYNKENLDENNLITLCKQCNIRANFNRDYWYAYFIYIIENKSLKICNTRLDNYILIK